MSDVEKVSRIMGWVLVNTDVPGLRNCYYEKRGIERLAYEGGNITNSGLVAIENRLFEVANVERHADGTWCWAFWIQPYAVCRAPTRAAAAIAALLAISQPEAE